ncbi:MAG: hypothetical protein KC582_03050 [Candidatus Magasanikbacteria bacterium]|nr:hypothetical protein [Candidatus Magasanikbacteria bacterium]MCA9389627.1 hypothetical protein [Candidatus Magasanikbacteria bacterium]MCA9391207.1 hypothetical protein [Candidatus Magasanikbacteria bacterium]USN52145.1 MAG: hypothetical protein H6759_03875 [Candidatus Nomurabacteria bacterium]HPF94969.1 hypothetical protein [bacterium]
MRIPMFLTESRQRAIAILVMSALILGGLFVYTFTALPSVINGDSYQAVFLTNDQVYFGKLVSTRGSYKLTDVYYLQSKQPVQAQGTEVGSEGDMALIKLGKELHGPEDWMLINREHVIFVEQLKSDSRVVQAIKKAKAGN